MSGRGEETTLYKISQASNIIGVKEGILRKWDKKGLIKTVRTPGGMRLFDISSIHTIQNDKNNKNNKNEKIIIIYTRITSIKQEEDLEQQKKYIMSNMPKKYTEYQIKNISDIGSGINFKRPGLLQILKLIKEGQISTIIISSKDKLAIYGFELIEWLCNEFGTEIIILDSEHISERDKDFLNIAKVIVALLQNQ